MIHHLFADFLDDSNVYRQVVEYWRDLWTRLEPLKRGQLEWIEPWLSTGAPTILDGNPIFSAYSPKLRKGIRVVQYPPASADDVEFDYWLDTYGGDITDPQSIQELVISCALSEESARLSRLVIEPWLSGPVSLQYTSTPIVRNAVIEVMGVGEAA
jgi:hypothetical protein